jgi:hypothetical protein
MATIKLLMIYKNRVSRLYSLRMGVLIGNNHRKENLRQI